MDPMVETPRVALLETASQLMGRAVALVGCLVLLGWALDIPSLKNLLTGSVTMKANAATAFVLSAVPLGLWRDRRTWRHAIARGCAALVVLIGVLTLTEYAFGWDLHIDEWLFRDAVDAPGTSHPGRMAPLTALGFVLLGLAELTLDHARADALGQWLAIAVGYLGVLNLVGYAYRVQGLSHLYSPASAYTEMALHTAGAFVVVSGAVLCARPERGMMAIATSQTAGGVVARRLLPAALGLPLVLGWLRLLGERAGLWTFQAGWGLLALSTLTVLVVIVWRSARVLHQTDGQRQQVEAALRRAHDDLETQVQQRTRALSETVHALQMEMDERQRVEQALRQAEALRSVAQLANAAAHEINNPLSIVAGQLEMLKGQSSNDPDTLARIEKARAAVLRIQTILGSMARITRLERLDWSPNLPPLLDLRRSGAPDADETSTPDDASQA
jgi:His Kinase A (phospho-acceptor) domain